MLKLWGTSVFKTSKSTYTCTDVCAMIGKYAVLWAKI